MARKATLVLEAETARAKENVRELDVTVDRLGDTSDDAASNIDRSAERMAESYRDVDEAADRAAASTSRMGGASSSASQFIFDASDAAQDMGHSLQAGANNAGFLFEQFGRVQSEAGSLTGGLKNIFGALAGPAGIAFGVTTALQHSDKLIAFFTESEQAAEGAAEAYKSAASELLSVDAGIPIDNIELGLKRSREFLKSAKDTIQAREEQIEQLARLKALRSPLQEVQQAEEQQIAEEIAMGAEDRTVEEIIRDIEERFGLETKTFDAIEERLKELREEKTILEGQKEDLKTQVDEAEALQTVYENLPEDVRAQAKAQKDAADAAERHAGAAERIANALSGPNVFQQAQARRLLRGMQRRGTIGMQPAGVPGFRPRDMFPSQSQIATMGTRARGIGHARAQTQALQGSLQAMRQMGFLPQQLTFEQIVGEIQNAGDEGNQQIARMISAAGQLGTALSSAFQEGKKEAEDVAAILLQSIGGFLTAIAPGTAGLSAIPGAALSAAGGLVGSFHSGGFVDGSSKEVAARLLRGEFVVNAESAKQVPNLLQAINQGPSAARMMQNLASFSTPEDGPEVLSLRGGSKVVSTAIRN